eukprot:4882672-Prymnesium_polylepis.1
MKSQGFQGVPSSTRAGPKGSPCVDAVLMQCLMLESATPTMHSTSVASACAIERLLDEPPPDLIHDAAQFVQLARERLVLDNSSMAAAIMFAQPLIKLWQPHWKFAYAVGLNMGIKYTTD